MIIFHTALRPEATPLIQHLGLKKKLAWNTHEVFESDTYAVLIGGMGKVRSAVALSSYLASRYYQDTKLFKKTLVVSLGIAAGHEARGTCYSIVKVKDEASGRRYYPDYVLKSPFPESTLITVDRPVSDGGTGYSELVDMEASGIFEAARPYTGTHQLLCFKIISDAYECGVLSAREISALIEQHVPTLVEYALAVQEHTARSLFMLSNEEQDHLTSLATEYHFSQAQNQMLQDWALSYKARGGELLTLSLPGRPKDTQVQKQDRHYALEQLRALLYAA